MAKDAPLTGPNDPWVLARKWQQNLIRKFGYRPNPDGFAAGYMAAIVASAERAG
jgi:hypothetical protein